MTGKSLKSAATVTAKPAHTDKRTKRPDNAAVPGLPGGKLGKMIALLKRPKGATVAEIMKATDWQAHSVRGAISGAIKTNLKLSVVSEKAGDVRTYRIAS